MAAERYYVISEQTVNLLKSEVHGPSVHQIGAPSGIRTAGTTWTGTAAR
jgi:hypothetical protein